MADLFDRITTNPDNEEPALSVHYLASSLVLVHLGEFTANQIKNYFNMDSAASNDFDVLVTNLNAQSTKADKLEFMMRLVAANDGVEAGAIATKAQYKNILGI